MKKTYPRYKQGEVQLVEKRLSKDEKETLKEFLKKCSITAAPKKVEKIKRLILQLRDVTQTSLLKQTKTTIDDFLVLLSNSDKSHWTKDEIKIYVKQFILWLYKNPDLVENFKACSKKGLNPEKVTENNLVTKEDIEKMLRFASGYKDKAYLLLAFQTGARPQELVELKWKDINFKGDSADITLFSKKTKQSRTFPIVKETMKALWEWKQHYQYIEVTPHDYVFVSRWRDKPLTTAALNKMLRKMSSSAKLGKDVWNYLLRHSRATKLYEELPQQIVEKLMGHKNMAGIYAHISSQKARDMMMEKIYKVDKLSEKQKVDYQKLEKEIEKYKEISLESLNQTKYLQKVLNYLINTKQINYKNFKNFK